MLEKIKALLAEELGVNADEITAETSFKEDLGADSLDLFELVTNLEEEYNIEIPAASIPVQLRFRALLWKALSASFSSMSSVPLCRLHICQSIFSGSLSVSRMYLFQERN